MSTFDTNWNNLKPFKHAKAIAWVEATRRSYNDLKAKDKGLSFSETVEAIRTSDFSSVKDYRALKGLGELRAQTVLKDQTEVQWFDSLSARADDSAVEKIQQRFSCPTDSMTV